MLDACAAFDDRTVADRGRPDDLDVGGNAHAVAEDDRPVQLSRRIDAATFARQHALTNPLPEKKS